MLKRILAVLIIFSFVFPPSFCFAQSSASDVLVRLATEYYNKGYYNEALHEFTKALIADPHNEEARRYVQIIRSQKENSREDKINKALDIFEHGSVVSPYVVNNRESAINSELDRISNPQKLKKPVAKPKEKKAPEKTMDYVTVQGQAQLSFGVESPHNFIWKEANGDLNERNYRILFGEKLSDTYDPAIYDRLRFNIDTKNLDQLGLNNISAHANITIDPWSFTGKTDKFTVNGVPNDAAEFQLKYWGNTGRTINEIVSTLVKGDTIALPEIKVIDGRTVATTAKSSFGNTFTLPSQNINMQFMPVRELWFDYKDEEVKFRFFPIAYQDQALTTDDPMGLSNHHTWWDQSPWLNEWKPGVLNQGLTGPDFTKGLWDDSLAFFTRDSDLVRLTSLRGFAFAYDGVDTKFQSTMASPKNLWEDYDHFGTYDIVNRYKHDFAYNFGVGLTQTGHFGLNENNLDAVNNAIAGDVKYEPVLGTKVSGQIAASQSSFDRTSDYGSRKRGNAYFAALDNRFPGDDIYEKDFNTIQKNTSETSFLKSRLRVARMDEGFESTLSSYRQTRDDEFWSRHITFRKHPTTLYTGFTTPVKYDDILPYAIGDGLDSGREVAGWRLEGASKIFDRDLSGLFDVRNVRSTEGKFIENVIRVQLDYDVTSKLTTKFLGIRQDLPNTVAGIDPFVVDPVTDTKFQNNAIPDGADPSLRTASLGAEYKVTDKVTVNGVWEYTNDSTIGSDNFPRGLFNNSFMGTFVENGKVYRHTVPFLYDQAAFGIPPYPYFNIYKAGITFTPVKEVEIYLDTTFNQDKFAGQKDENMNHYSLEIDYHTTPKLAFFFKYTYSRWFDTAQFLATSGNEVILQWHNNFSLGGSYQIDKDSYLMAEYGIGAFAPLGLAVEDPNGGSLPVLDTQHIIRVTYLRKF